MLPETVSYSDCIKHGRRRWRGHFACSSCGRVYQSTELGKPWLVRQTCECGVQLMPTDAQLAAAAAAPATEPIARTWSGRPICYLCHRQIAKTGGIGTIIPMTPPAAAPAEVELVPDSPAE